MGQVLVTGGAGFIGSHLVDGLLASGAAVTILDNFSTGRPENLAERPTITILKGDVGEERAVVEAMRGCMAVVHLAALASVQASFENPHLNHKSNVTGFLNVLEAARQLGIKRVVYASSAAVYGNLVQLPKRENDPLSPISPYAFAKWLNEQYAQFYATTYGLECIGLRFFNVYGSRQDPYSPYSGVITRFYQALKSNQSCLLFGDGQQTRDFVHVGDVVQAIIAALHSPITADFPPAFNIGSGMQTSLLILLETMGQVLNIFPQVTYQPTREGDIRHSQAAIDLAQQFLGFVPRTTLAEGLLELWGAHVA